MNLTIKEAKYLLKGLDELINLVDSLADIYAPSDKKVFFAEIIEKQSEGLTKLYIELADYVSKVEHETKIEFNFEDYL